MSGPDRHEPIDPADDRWPQEDPDVTRVVPRGDQRDTSRPAGSENPPDGGDAPGRWGGPDAPNPGSSTDGTIADAPAGEAPAGGVPVPVAPSSPYSPGGDGHRGTDERSASDSSPGGDGNRRPDEPAGWPPSNWTGPETATPGSATPETAAPGSAAPEAPAPRGSESEDRSGYSGYSGYSGASGEPDSGATTAMPPYRGPDTGAPPTTYIGAPTTHYPGPPSAGQQGYAGPPSGGYSYQQGAGYQQGTGYQQDTGQYGPGMTTGPTPAGPQVIPAPPATANVVLPPVRMPKAESRVALNALGTVVGLLVVGGGLILLLLFAPKLRSDTGGLDYAALTLTIVGAILIALAALITAWASWAAIVPGFLLAGVSVWAMVTSGGDSGSRFIGDGTRWIFGDERFAGFCANGLGLMVGLLLLFAGLAAVFLRAAVRRTIREQLESIQS